MSKLLNLTELIKKKRNEIEEERERVALEQKRPEHIKTGLINFFYSEEGRALFELLELCNETINILYQDDEKSFVAIELCGWWIFNYRTGLIGHKETESFRQLGINEVTSLIYRHNKKIGPEEVLEKIRRGVSNLFNN